MSKWTVWYDNLPEHTRKYLKNQPIWHDSDMLRSGLIGLVIGFILGVML